MSARTNAAPEGRAADLPLGERRCIEAEQQRELGEGLTRCHLGNAAERDAVAAHTLAHALRNGPALRAALCKGRAGTV